MMIYFTTGLFWFSFFISCECANEDEVFRPRAISIADKLKERQNELLERQNEILERIAVVLEEQE